nr:hypothetical protein [Elizabethkingia sp. ASV34]
MGNIGFSTSVKIREQINTELLKSENEKPTTEPVSYTHLRAHET